MKTLKNLLFIISSSIIIIALFILAKISGIIFVYLTLGNSSYSYLFYPPKNFIIKILIEDCIYPGIILGFIFSVSYLKFANLKKFKTIITIQSLLILIYYINREVIFYTSMFNYMNNDLGLMYRMKTYFYSFVTTPGISASIAFFFFGLNLERIAFIKNRFSSDAQ